MHRQMAQEVLVPVQVAGAQKHRLSLEVTRAIDACSVHNVLAVRHRRTNQYAQGTAHGMKGIQESYVMYKYA